MTEDEKRAIDLNSLAHNEQSLRDMMQTLRETKFGMPGNHVSVVAAQSLAHQQQGEAQRYLERWPDDPKGQRYKEQATNLIHEIARIND